MTDSTRDLVDATLKVAGLVEELKALNFPALHKSFDGSSTCSCNLAERWAYTSDKERMKDYPGKTQDPECAALEKFFREKGLLGEEELLVSAVWENSHSWPENCFTPLWPLARFVRQKSDPLGRFFFGDGELGPAMHVAREAQSAFRRKNGAG